MKKNSRVGLMCYKFRLMGVLSFLIFSCMADTENGNNPEDLDYSTPHPKYLLSGKVINEKQEPLSEIMMIIGEIYKDAYTEDKFIPDTLYTDAKGEFSYLKNKTSPIANTLRVISKSIDRKGNIGIYESEQKDIEMSELTVEGRKDIVITMKEKNKEETDNK